MSKRIAAALLSLLLIAAAVRIRWFTGLQCGDDIVYSKVAVERLHGKTDIGNTQQTRSAFLLPIVVSYAIFGPGEGPLLLYNLVCSVALVAALFFLARRWWGDTAGLIAGAMVAVHPNLVRFATECHTDTPLALWLTLVVALVVSAGEGDPKARRRILAGALLGWAWLHKESTVYMGFFFLAHWRATRRPWTWYLPVAVPLLATAGLELAGYAMHTGNPLERFAQLRRWHSGTYMAEKYTTVASILYREFLELPVHLFVPWIGRETTGLVNLAGLASAVLLIRRRAPGATVIAAWFLALYAGYCFWPSSLVPFLPGFFLFQWTLPVFGPPLALALGGALSRVQPRLAGAVVVGLAALSLVTIDRAWTADRRMVDGCRESSAWLAREKVARIVTDDKTIEALDFFEGHAPSRRYVRFQDATEFEGSVVIVDRFWTERGQWWSRPAPEIPASWRKVHESERITIYRP